MPKKKTHKKRFAAPKFVANADELQNRNNEMATQQAARRGRRIAAGCDDEDLKDGEECSELQIAYESMEVAKTIIMKQINYLIEQKTID